MPAFPTRQTPYYTVVSARQPDIALWEQVRLAATPFARLRGLLGVAQLQPQQGLWLKPCNSIHSFFMQFPFDALFLDRQGTVVRVLQAMPRGKVSPLVWRACQVLEVPAGSVAAHGIQVGDQLRLLSPADALRAD